MQVGNLRAEPDPRGGRVELSWTTPRRADFPHFQGVKVVRRENSFPDERQIKEDPGVHLDTHTGFGQPAAFTDAGLDGETNYYYAVVAFSGGAVTDYFPAFVSAMATTPYGTAEQLYAALPNIYARFDTLTPPAVPRLDPEDLTKGQLRRLVEMFGLQFDLMRSYASATSDFMNVERVDGALLPLLAQWLGWPTDFSLPFAKQRNEIRYASHLYRTTGIAANLRATLNRLTTWNAEIKEFVHNVFNANDPERLAVYEAERDGVGAWGEPRLVSIETAYEGRVCAARETDERQWLFYHAAQKARGAPSQGGAPPTPTQGSEFCAPGDLSHLWFKLWDFDRWTPSQRLTNGARVCKYPAAVRRRADGSFWVFYGEFEDQPLAPDWRLRLCLLAAGHRAELARLQGAKSGPFELEDGDHFRVRLVEGGRVVSNKTVVFHAEHFRDISRATAAEVAALLNREMAGVEFSVSREGKLLLKSSSAGAGVHLRMRLKGAAKLGLSGAGVGADAAAAQLAGGEAQTFALSHNDTLVLKYDGGLPRVVVFRARNFNDISKATAAEVAAVINQYVPRGAEDKHGRVVLASPTEGEGSSVVVDVNRSTAAAALGFGLAPPSAPNAEESEPAAFEDKAGGVWLFWSSRGDTDGLKIWYNRFDGQKWDTSRALTSGATADREPFVLFAEAEARLWVFWTGRKGDGRKNIFWRTTTNLDFATQTAGDWAEHELSVEQGIEYDNAEASAFAAEGGGVELYFSSTREDGRHVWSSVVTPAGEESGPQVKVTAGRFTQCAPAALGTGGARAKLLFRSNESQIYESPLYPGSRTFDARYSGSTITDTSNHSKFGARGRYDDTMHYLSDAGRGNDDWYARDTVGVYLTPDTDDDALVVRKRNQIESLLRGLLPIQVRAVVIIQQVFPEVVYTYNRPHDKPRLIGERWYDSRLGEVYGGAADDYADAVSFHWFRLWEAGHTPDEMPDTDAHPPDLSARLFLNNVKEGD